MSNDGTVEGVAAPDALWIQKYDQNAHPEFKWSLLTPEQQIEVRQTLGNVDKYGLWHEVVCMAHDAHAVTDFLSWISALSEEMTEWDVD